MSKVTVTLVEQTCPMCDGTKTMMGYRDYGSFLRYENGPCFRCGGRGIVKVNVVRTCEDTKNDEA